MPGSNISQIRKLNYNGEDIGMGFNSDTGLGIGTALDFDAPVAVLSQEAQGEVTIVTSHEHLMSSLNMSAELEGRYAFSSASMKASFSKSTDYNSSSTFVVARAVINDTVERGRNFRVKPEAKTLLDTNQKDIFDRAFGDSFVRAHYRGGEFYAVMRITSVDSKTESNLALSLHASVQTGLASVDFAGDLKKANLDENTRSEFSAKFYQKGGVGKEEIGVTIDVEDIKARLKNFPDAIKDHAFPFFIEVATYDTIPLPLPTKEQQEDFLLAMNDADAKKLHYIEAGNDCGFAAEHPEYFFEPPARSVLLVMGETYTQLLNAVMSHAVRLSRGEINPPQMFDPGKLNPPLAEPTIILRKKDVGLEASFADFWVDKDLPATRHTDRDLVVDIGFLVMEQLNDFNSIVDPGGDPLKTLRLQGQALSRIASTLRAYDWDHAGMHSASRMKLTSLSKLPVMLPKTVNTLAFVNNEIDSCEGLEQFGTLVALDLSHNKIPALDELSNLTTLRSLQIVDNQVVSLAPLQKCLALETLDISGNNIADLTPLAACKVLKNLTLSGTLLIENGVSRPSGNPLANTAALAQIPALANPFTVGKVLNIRLGVLKDGPDKQFTGTATRVAGSNRFHVELTSGATVRSETWEVSAIAEVTPKDWENELISAMAPGASASDLPATGAQVNLHEADKPMGFIGVCYVDPANPQTAVIDLARFPIFGTKFPFPTVDATVVS